MNAADPEGQPYRVGLALRADRERSESTGMFQRVVLLVGAQIPGQLFGEREAVVEIDVLVGAVRLALAVTGAAYPYVIHIQRARRMRHVDRRRCPARVKDVVRASGHRLNCLLHAPDVWRILIVAR